VIYICNRKRISKNAIFVAVCVEVCTLEDLVSQQLLVVRCQVFLQVVLLSYASLRLVYDRCRVSLLPSAHLARRLI
jgi:hypothetical protein